MGKLKHKVLFVCPTNKLTQNSKENGVTLNKFFSIGMTEDSNLARFDDSPYDVIVFDEIYFANVRMLARIKKYADNNPDKIIIATGDTNQLETCDPLVEELGDQYSSYVNQCIDSIFPNAMFLKENKRLKSEEDKRNLKQVKMDIFDEKKPIIETIRRYFKFTDDIDTIENIAYRNETCNTVSKTIRKLLKKQHDFEKNEILVCRQYTKLKGGVFHVNYEYKIVKIKDDFIGLRDASDNKADVIVIPKSLPKNYSWLLQNLPLLSRVKY